VPKEYLTEVGDEEVAKHERSSPIEIGGAHTCPSP
jgi:hypothetical protein